MQLHTGPTRFMFHCLHTVVYVLWWHSHIIHERHDLIHNLPPTRPYLSLSPKKSRASYQRMRTHPRREPTSCGRTLKRKTMVSGKHNPTHTHTTMNETYNAPSAVHSRIMQSHYDVLTLERGEYRRKFLLPFLSSCSDILPQILHFTIRSLV